MPKKIVIILGPPGSGKGTQAKLLQEKFGLEYIGSGQMLRERKQKSNYTGHKIAQIIDKGRILPTPVIFNLWMNKLELYKEKEGDRSKKFNGIIMDGSPRTVEEAVWLEQALEWYGWHKGRKAIFIDISTKEAVWRITKRRICSRCKRLIPYIGEWRQLKKCDKCGGPLVVRADDNAKATKERLNWYKSKVKPVIEYYQKKKALVRINGEQPIEKVFEDILKKLK